MKPFPEPPAPPVIPDHQLLRQVGEGSYGEIWLARNIIGTYRAVKIVYRARFDDAQPYEREFKGIQKFEPISRSHPGLVNLLQIGRNDVAGYFYYVMELADDMVGGNEFHPETYSAKTLGKELGRRGRLPAQEALQLGIHLAEALAYMHQQGLVHRDIKPSNIIFVQGRPKLADIGLVMSLRDARTFVGTEGYIPPEGPGTAQSDIYSLGKVLYEMSTGQYRDLFPRLPDDLDSYPDRALLLEMNAVFLKACEGSVKNRYGRAEQLGADLELALAGQSILRLRFLERQLARVTRLAAVAITVAVAAGVLAVLVSRVQQREKKLLATAYITEGVQRMENGNWHAALPPLAAALRLHAGDAAQTGTDQQRLSSALAQAPRLLHFWSHGKTAQDVRFSPDGTQLLVAGGDSVRLTQIDSGALVREFQASNHTQAAAFSPEGRRLAFNDGRFLIVAELSPGTNLFSIALHTTPKSVEFSPDGASLLVACRHKEAHLLDARTGENRRTFTGHADQLHSAAFSPDGLRIVTGSRDGSARVWETQTGQQLLTLWPAPDIQTWVHDAVFSPDGRRIVTAAENFTVQVWGAEDGRKELGRMEHPRVVTRARFSPDGRRIVSVGDDFMMRFWDARTGRPSGSVVNFSTLPKQVVFSPESRRVATAETDGAIKIWDVSPDAPVEVGLGVVSPDGARYVTWTPESVRVWNATNDQPVTPLLAHAEPFRLLGCDAGARQIVLTGPDEDNTHTLVQVLGAATGSSRLFTLPHPTNRMWMSADGELLLTGHDKTVRLWSLQNGQLVFPERKLSHSIKTAVFSPDRRQLAVASGSLLYLIDTASGVELFPPRSHAPHIDHLAFSPDGTVLATATEGNIKAAAEALLWDVRTGQRHGPALRHLDGVLDLQFTSDGEFLATASEDTQARVWRAATGELRFDPIRLSWHVCAVDFSPGDRWLFTTATREARLWDAHTGQAITPQFSVGDMVSPEDWFVAGGFCADGRRVWTKSGRGLSFWNLPRIDHTADEWTALARLLGVTLPAALRTPAEAFPEAQLRAFCTREAARTTANIPAWHEAEARRAERGRNWFAAQFHLARLQQIAPDDAALRARLVAAQLQVQVPGGENAAP